MLMCASEGCKEQRACHNVGLDLALSILRRVEQEQELTEVPQIGVPSLDTHLSCHELSVGVADSQHVESSTGVALSVPFVNKLNSVTIF
jgi:hypothetical protein